MNSHRVERSVNEGPQRGDQSGSPSGGPLVLHLYDIMPLVTVLHPGPAPAHDGSADREPEDVSPEDRHIEPTAMYSALDVQRVLDASERTVCDLPLRWVRFGRGKMVLGRTFHAGAS